MSQTADRSTMERYDPTANRDDLPATDSTQYFKGAIVALVAGKLVIPTTATVGASSCWVCEDNVLTGVSTTVLVGVRCGTFKFLNGDSIVAADVGKLAFVGASTGDSVFKAGAAATDVVVGVIQGVDGATAQGGAGVWVKVFGWHEIVGATAGTNVSGS